MQWRNFGAKAAATAALVAGGGTLAIDQTVLNPYDDKGTHYELPIKSDIPQGERVEIAKDKAAMTLKGWNDEYAITIEPQIPTALLGAAGRPFVSKGNRPLLSKKMEYKHGDVTAFVEPKTGKENEFDIDFTLHSRPDTNVFQYRIDGASDFDFFFQPELSQDEVLRGDSRPENIVGSYAVYHKIKKNNAEGRTNYGTGKILHIYRPKVVDSNGSETWAEIKYENHILSVTVPQKYLDEASYPVLVDPTFGYTSAGASNSLWGANTLFVSGTSSMPVTAKVVNLRWYGTSNSASINAKGIIYADAQYPTTLQASSTAVVAPPTIATANPYWISMPFSNRPTLSAGNYWLGQIAGANFPSVRYDLAGTLGIHDAAGTYANPEATYPAGDATTTPYSVSIYATYCTEGAECEEIFNAGGTYTWTVPTGVTSAKIACWGGGGGGFDDNTGTNAGAGGGGGAFASSTVALTPGSNYTVTIATSSPENLPATGKFSRFIGNDKTVLACGGTGATSATANGTGGTTACSTGDVETAGSDGSDAVTTDDTGGGGGAAGGPAGAGGASAAGTATVGGGGGGGNGGGAASGSTGGTAGSNAGGGGNGGNASNGFNGGSGDYGGGGGGGGDNGQSGGDGGYPGGGGAGGEANGGQGAGGQCIITYTVSGGGGGGATPDNTYFEIISALLLFPLAYIEPRRRLI